MSRRSTNGACNKVPRSLKSYARTATEISYPQGLRHYAGIRGLCAR
jgi:hypothetical protein